MFDLSKLPNLLIAAGSFALLGIVVFALVFFLMAKFTPFSLRKEIEEDQNVAMGVIVAGVLIGVAIIIGAAIHG